MGRDQATREATDVQDDHSADGQDTDRAHDRLREIESVMRFIEDRAVPDATGVTWLTGDFAVFEKTVVGVAARALAALVAEHERFTSAGPCDGAPLLAAADTVRAAIATPVATHEVDHGPVDEAYRGLVSGVGDIFICLESGDIDTAQRLRRRFIADLRLLDDLGWSPTDERQTFTLTMKPRRRDAALDSALHRCRTPPCFGRPAGRTTSAPPSGAPPR